MKQVATHKSTLCTGFPPPPKVLPTVFIEATSWLTIFHPCLPMPVAFSSIYANASLSLP